MSCVPLFLAREMGTRKHGRDRQFRPDIRGVFPVDTAYLHENNATQSSPLHVPRSST
jgi:hypothetical protein